MSRDPEPVENELQAKAFPFQLDTALLLEEEIGRGGMGNVYRATDSRLNRAVAVKVLAEKFENSPAAQRRFIVEAQVAAQLEHPNIVPLYGLFVTETGSLAQSMKMIEGQSFYDYLRACGETPDAGRRAPFDLATRVEHFLKACDAMAYAHARGVVHRDLKPANILLGLHNEVYVTDWGVAKVLHDGTEGRGEDDSDSIAKLGRGALTRERSDPDSDIQVDVVDAKDTIPGDIVGSVRYMAPEQASGRPVTPAADQYSLGLILQQILTLEFPREGATYQEQLKRAITNQRRAMKHKYGRRVPRAAAAIVAKATATEPANRYPDVRAFAEDIRRFVRDESVVANPDGVLGAAWRRLRKRPGALVLLLALAGGGAAVTGVVRGLKSEMRVREIGVAQNEQQFAVASRVTRVASGLESRFARIQALVGALSAMVLESRRAVPVNAAGAPARIEKRFLTEKEVDKTIMDARPGYTQRVTFERPLALLPGGVASPEALTELARLGDLDRAFAIVATRSTGSEEGVNDAHKARTQRAREASRVRYLALGLPSGAMVTYPGAFNLGSANDSRQQAWYTAGLNHRDTVWLPPFKPEPAGEPHVACAMSLYDEEGKFVGVVAAMAAVSDLRAELAVDIPGAEAVILDAAGNVVVGNQETAAAAPGTPFAIEAIRESVARGSAAGHVRSGNALVVYSKLGILDWTLAVRTEASAAR